METYGECGELSPGGFLGYESQLKDGLGRISMNMVLHFWLLRSKQ